MPNLDPTPESACQSRALEIDTARRLLIGGLAGAALGLVASQGHAQTLRRGESLSSPEGLVRTLLESHTDPQGNEFRLVLDTFPPGIVIAPHHHPTPGLNYVLKGVAESQYEGEELRRLKAGDSFVDHANRRHLLFRNPDPHAPVLVLISYMVGPGQAFFVPE